MKAQTLSAELRGQFRASPYPSSRPPSSISSVSTGSGFSAPSAITGGHKRSSASQSTSTKGKNSLEQMKLDLRGRLDEFSQGAQEQKLTSAALKTERYQIKMQYHMREKEIAHLQTQTVNECAEAENIHRRTMESKQIDLEIRKADIEVLDKERELLNLKLLLARALHPE